MLKQLIVYTYGIFKYSMAALTLLAAVLSVLMMLSDWQSGSVTSVANACRGDPHWFVGG